MIGEELKREEVTRRVYQVIARLLNIEEESIRAEDSIFEHDDRPGLGLDSLDVLNLSVALADEFDIREPPDIDWASVTTVDQAASVLYGVLTGNRP